MTFIPPMLARPVRELPVGPRWQYEIKWDGYRMQALKNGSSVQLLSRNQGDYTKKYAGVTAAIARLHAETATLDGEIVALDASGMPSFQALQKGRSSSIGWRITFYAFDLLQHNGVDLQNLPLLERQKRLSILLGTSSDVKLSPVLNGPPQNVIEAVRLHHLEGIVAKRVDSKYEPGKRTGAWVKLALKRQQEFVIGGFRPGLGALELTLVGYYSRDKFLFAGKVRQGLTPRSRQLVYGRLKNLVTSECPFANLPNSRTDHFGETLTAEEMPEYSWVEPRIVMQVKFTEWTRLDVLRHAEFVALRDDKAPFEIVREI